MVEIIKQKLLELEQLHHIKILYACESGSRAWGFASPDSDFDVRFIYARCINDYLNIRDIPDTLGLPVNEILDIGGWDIKKSLKLFLKSNAPLYEWLQSPIIYVTETGFTDELRSIMPKYFLSRAAANHYLSMAKNTLVNDLNAEQVKLKRYFYALRPALACLWVVENQSVPPMEFEKLRIQIRDKPVQQEIENLLEQKKLADEKALITPVSILNNWLGQTLTYCSEHMAKLQDKKQGIEELNILFRKYIS
jgi:predicted nucleotidyltransferase